MTLLHLKVFKLMTFFFFDTFKTQTNDVVEVFILEIYIFKCIFFVFKIYIKKKSWREHGVNKKERTGFGFYLLRKFKNYKPISEN